MRALTLIAALCLSAVAPPSIAGDMLASQNGDTVRLTQKPCQPSVLRVIPEGMRGPFRAALVLFQGAKYHACWAVRTDGMVLVVYADGDQGLIPISMFTMEPDA